MNLPMYQVDAFTTQRFRGNPAAVVVLTSWLPDGVMQEIAAENNLAETAFVIPGGDPTPLRWFTPTFEIDLCGHATLATAHVLFRHHFPQAERFAFQTKSGILTVIRDGDRLSMDFPSRPGTPVSVNDALTGALGAKPQEALLARDLLAVFETEEQVRALKPDFQRVAQLEAMAVIASAPGESVDFVSRFFAPKAGINEDPVTGSSHCTLIPYWAGRLGKKILEARQISPRGGDLRCELRGDRVVIGGAAVEYLRGEIQVDA
ncbi:MAG TPA: PhzF family phenazine biosynthesis protein [Candidatus Saccharimonadales bacterium]|nr:PhzF family phenazine biosynthesis protein [Candidatus Saccharimonadales bacterium]